MVSGDDEAFLVIEKTEEVGGRVQIGDHLCMVA
jgi:hypothetical protein